MLSSYEDIRSRISEAPKWFDQHGVPRYGEFHPALSPNLYAKEVVLYEVACQSCDTRFLVESNWSVRAASSLTELVETKALRYGDPPCQECLSGSSMLSVPIKTVQFWRLVEGTWSRIPELEEIPLDT